MGSKLREKNFRLLTAFNLVAYSCVALSFGVFVGFGFGHYQHQRFKLIEFRLIDIDKRAKALQETYDKTYKLFTEYVIPKSEILKKRSFSSNCTVSFDEGKQMTTENYTKKTQLFGVVSGIDIDLNDKKDFMKCKADFLMREVDSEKHLWEVKENYVEPKADFPLCWIAVPGNDYE